MLIPLFGVEASCCTLMFITFTSDLVIGFFGRKRTKVIPVHPIPSSHFCISYCLRAPGYRLTMMRPRSSSSTSVTVTVTLLHTGPNAPNQFRLVLHPNFRSPQTPAGLVFATRLGSKMHRRDRDRGMPLFSP